MNCYLLVGGQSSRMGRPKADLKIAGLTFLERSIAACDRVFDETVAVQRIREPAVTALRTVFESEHDERAPIFGIIRALEDSKSSAWVLAIDYPLMTSKALVYFAESFHQSGAECWVPEWDGSMQMLCAGYSDSLLPRLRRAVANGDLSIQKAITGANVVSAREQGLRARIAGEPLFNVNDGADYERASAIGGTG